MCPYWCTCMPGRCLAAERGNPFLSQLLLYILLWWHAFLSSGEKWPVTLDEMERKETWGLPCTMSLGHHPEGGELPLGSERWGWPGAATLPREALWTRHGITEMPHVPFHLSLTAFLSLLPCEVPLGWWGAFHLARSGGGSPATPKGKQMLLCVISFPYGKTWQKEGGADGCICLKGE